jgi:uncharacterized protein (DUF1684 family)
MQKERTSAGVLFRRNLLCTLSSGFWILNSGFLLSSACRPAEPRYEHTILEARSEKDRVFKTSDESPLRPAERQAFTALSYFPPDESYRTAAALRVAPEAEQRVVTMPTSTGKQRDYRQLGAIEFNLKGQPLSLVAFVEEPSPGAAVSRRLFVPFGDLTNGAETYPAGRYLDLDPTPTGLYDLDFNKAYNPFCAYNDEYDCPYPPASNRLKIPVRAGEKAFSVLSAGT